MSTKSDDETATDRPDYVTSRVRYFNGEFLATKDFIAEQDYHVDRQVRHQAQLHAPGIQDGLEVTQTASQVGTESVTIGAGTALDDRGNQILIGEAVVLRLSDLPTDIDAGDNILDLMFDETPSDPQPSGGESRFTQDPATMLAIGPSLRDGAVPLARVRVAEDGDGNKVISGVDTDYFTTEAATPKYAGVQLPGPPGDDTATLRVQNTTTNASDAYPGDPEYNAPNYKVVLDKSLRLNASPSGSNSTLEIEQGALIFYGDGDIWSHGYNKRIRLHNDGVELLAHAKVTLTTNNADTDTDPLHTLVAYQSGAVGIGTDADEPVARLEVKGPIPDPHNIHGSNTLNLQVSSSDGSALLAVADSGATTVSGPLTAGDTLDVTGLLTASGGLEVNDSGVLEFDNAHRQMIGLNDTGTCGIGRQTDTVYLRSDYGFAFYQGGTHVDDKQDPGGGKRVLAVGNGGNVLIPQKLAIGSGDSTDGPSDILEVHDTQDATALLFSIGSSQVAVSIPLNASAGLTVSSTQIDDSGQVAIGKSSAPSNPLEVYDGANELLSVSASDGLTIAGGAHMGGLLTASGGLTISGTQIDDSGQVAIGKSSAPSNPLEVYDGANELLSVSSSDGMRVAGGAHVDGLLTASGGLTISGTQIDDSGQVAIGKPSAPSNPLEVCDGNGSALLTVMGGEIDVSVVLKANQGLQVGAASSLFGDWQEIPNFTSAAYTAPSDGFIVARVQCDANGGNSSGSIQITVGDGPVNCAYAFNDDADSYSGQTLCGSVTVPVSRGKTFTIIKHTGGAGPTFYVHWVPIGSSVGLPSNS